MLDEMTLNGDENVRLSLGLGGAWRFMPDPHGDGETLGFWRHDFDLAPWGEVHVPSCFDAAAESMSGYVGIVWYRRSLRLPASWAGRRVMIRFEGVSYRAKVWLDNSLLGENTDPFLPFEFPVGTLLSDGLHHSLTVAVDNTAREEDVPGPHVQWHGFGGILRPVVLYATDPLYIRSLRIEAVPVPGGGRLAVQIQVVNETGQASSVRADVEITDPSGQCVRLLTTVGLAEVDQSSSLTLCESLQGASLWSPASPSLYRAVVRLHEGVRLSDERQVRFGFRRIEASPAGLLLNGRPIYLTGFNRHEDSPVTDMAADRVTACRDFTRMKEAGANFVRLCHYPHDPYDLDLCDELGLLALGEIPLNLVATPARIRTAARQLERMIERDVNHPCLVFWSVSNEINDEDPGAAEGNRSLIRRARALDPTRLCVHVSHRWKDHPNFDEDDVICINDYPGMEGWYGRRGSPPQQDTSLSAEKWKTNLATLHARHPDKLILVTEFGYCSLAGTAGHALGEDRHELMIRSEFPALQEPFVCGATIWCWADHPASPHRFLDGLTRSPFGVLRRDRTPKRAFAAVRELFRGRQGLQCLPHPDAAKEPR